MERAMPAFNSSSKDKGSIPPPKKWPERQTHKANGGLKASGEWTGEKEFLPGDHLTRAGIAAGSVFGLHDGSIRTITGRIVHPNLAI